MKLRHTEERSPTSLLLESPWETNTTIYDPKTYFRYRQIKYVPAPASPGSIFTHFAGMLVARTLVRSNT